MGHTQSSKLLGDRTDVTTGQISKTMLIDGEWMRIVMKSLGATLNTNLGV